MAAKKTAKKTGGRTTAKKAKTNGSAGKDYEALLAAKTPTIIEFPICTDSRLADTLSLIHI